MKSKNVPKLQKANRLVGKTLVFRNVTTKDAGFILELRTDSNKSRFLSDTSAELEKQIQWLKNYENKADQAYFIIENKMGERLGTVRLYDPRGNSFCWGSWIIKDGAPNAAAIESALIVYAYAIDFLGFSSAHFDVRKGNERVWSFHERFGAERVGESDLDYYYQISEDDINKSRHRYRKYLTESLIIEK